MCVAHVTNTMAAAGDDFEKGEAARAHGALALVAAMVGPIGPDGH